MERTLLRPHAVSILSTSKEALGESLNQAWDEIERLRSRIDVLEDDRLKAWRSAERSPGPMTIIG